MNALDKERKLFVLDTNVLMHDPAAIYHFEEHDIYLPMVVLEELDNHKTGISEVARNVRQINRILVELMTNTTHQQLKDGLAIPNFFDKEHVKTRGRLFFQTDEFEDAQPLSLPGHNVDNTLLATAFSLQKRPPTNKSSSFLKTLICELKPVFLGLLRKITTRIKCWMT